MQIPYWIWGGGGHVNSVLNWGGLMNSARAWPPFSGSPQHFSNEHSLSFVLSHCWLFCLVNW